MAGRARLDQGLGAYEHRFGPCCRLTGVARLRRIMGRPRVLVGTLVGPDPPSLACGVVDRRRVLGPGPLCGGSGLASRLWPNRGRCAVRAVVRRGFRGVADAVGPTLGQIDPHELRRVVSLAGRHEGGERKPHGQAQCARAVVEALSRSRRCGATATRRKRQRSRPAPRCRDAWKATAAARLLFSTDAGARWEPIRAGGRLVVVQGERLGCARPMPARIGKQPRRRGPQRRLASAFLVPIERDSVVAWQPSRMPASEFAPPS